jgi:hypothetical protein
MEGVMQLVAESSVADRRGLQLIGITLAALLMATTIIAAMLVHRGPNGDAYQSSHGICAQRLG